MSFDFNLPSATPIPSEFASADSFRGRVVLIEVTGYEIKVPMHGQPGKFTDRVTAKVTTVDGKGRVQIFSQKVPTGTYLEGPEHEGVWFSQDRIRKVIAPEGERSIGRQTLAVIETYKPGKIAGQGNPWGLLDPTPDQVAAAKTFLASLMVDGATAPGDASADPWATDGANA